MLIERNSINLISVYCNIKYVCVMIQKLSLIILSHFTSTHNAHFIRKPSKWKHAPLSWKSLHMSQAFLNCGWDNFSYSCLSSLFSNKYVIIRKASIPVHSCHILQGLIQAISSGNHQKEGKPRRFPCSIATPYLHKAHSSFPFGPLGEKQPTTRFESIQYPPRFHFWP